ncbi:hypothetical protein G3A43_08185 [Paraburkholderia aspalathi]|nr:hypothetical protein [Paraburkholderia aspalathi]
MQDRAFAARHPGQAFYLRVEKEGAVETYDLPGSVTPLDARRVAKELGFDATHWTGPDASGVFAF